MNNYLYCGGKGWCNLPYTSFQLPYTWEGGGPGMTITTWERCICPICGGLGFTLLPMPMLYDLFFPRYGLYTGPER